MSERCPLRSGLHWDTNELDPVMGVCQKQCGDIWTATMDAAPGEIEYSDSHPGDCGAEPEYLGVALKRTRDDRFGMGRIVRSVSECPEHEVIDSSEIWNFDCPYN